MDHFLAKSVRDYMKPKKTVSLISSGDTSRAVKSSASSMLRAGSVTPIHRSGRSSSPVLITSDEDEPEQSTNPVTTVSDSVEGRRSTDAMVLVANEDERGQPTNPAAIPDEHEPRRYTSLTQVRMTRANRRILSQSSQIQMMRWMCS